MSEKTSPKQFLFKVMFVSTFGNLLFGYDTGGNVTLHPTGMLLSTRNRKCVDRS